MIYSKEPESDQEQKLQGPSKGEKVLKLVGLPIDMTVRELLEGSPVLKQILNSPIMKQETKKLLMDDTTPLSSIIEEGIKVTKRNDFIFSKNYTVKGVFESPKGKWANAIKDSLFLDSTKFHIVYANKIMDRVLQVMHREMTQGKGRISEERYAATE